MAGRVGRNRAWNKLPVEEHLRRGTFRQDRHGKRPALIATIEPRDPGWHPHDDDTAHLQPAGRRFLDAMLSRFEISALEGAIVVEAAYLVDYLTSSRSEAATDPDAAKLALRQTQVLAALLGQLRVLA
jgi:hypothetical protein